MEEYFYLAGIGSTPIFNIGGGLPDRSPDRFTQDEYGTIHINLPLLKSREFENNLLLFILTAKDTESIHYLPLRDKIETILRLIEDGLE